MIEGLPAYIPVVFILTTLFTVGIFTDAIVRAGLDSLAGKQSFCWVLLDMAFTSSRPCLQRPLYGSLYLSETTKKNAAPLTIHFPPINNSLGFA